MNKTELINAVAEKAGLSKKAPRLLSTPLCPPSPRV